MPGRASGCSDGLVRRKASQFRCSTSTASGSAARPPLLAKAAELRDDEPRYAYVYAIALHDAGEMRRALDVLERAHERRPADRDILVALVEYYREAGDSEGAAAWARPLAEQSPEATH